MKHFVITKNAIGLDLWVDDKNVATCCFSRGWNNNADHLYFTPLSVVMGSTRNKLPYGLEREIILETNDIQKVLRAYPDLFAYLL